MYSIDFFLLAVNVQTEITGKKTWLVGVGVQHHRNREQQQVESNRSTH